MKEAGVFDPVLFRNAAAFLRHPEGMGDVGLSRNNVLSWLDRMGDLAEAGPDSLLEYSRFGGGIRGRKYKIESLIEI